MPIEFGLRAGGNDPDPARSVIPNNIANGFPAIVTRFIFKPFRRLARAQLNKTDGSSNRDVGAALSCIACFKAAAAVSAFNGPRCAESHA